MVTYQVAAALCSFFDYQVPVLPKSKDELVLLGYFYFQHCELLYLCILPLYKPAPPLAVLAIFMLSAYSLWLKIQLKPYILLIKYFANNEGIIVKLSSNYAVHSTY